jgi:hypothetical protein
MLCSHLKNKINYQAVSTRMAYLWYGLVLVAVGGRLKFADLGHYRQEHPEKKRVALCYHTGTSDGTDQHTIVADPDSQRFATSARSGTRSEIITGPKIVHQV